MKSGKTTKTPKGAEKRWYDDACGTALALEFVGERWSLLILRELMFGPRRFGEIRANLPGVSATVLTQRLEGLEEAGILVKRKLPSALSVQVYELTEWGYLAEPVVQEMGRWSTRSRRHDVSLFLSPASAMMSLRTMVDREKARGLAMTVAIHFPTDLFVATLADGQLTIRRGETGQAGVRFVTDPTSFAFTVYGKIPFEQMEADGRLRIEGDRAQAQIFVGLFELPEKLAD